MRHSVRAGCDFVKCVASVRCGVVRERFVDFLVLVTTLAQMSTSISADAALSTLGRQLSLGIVAVPADTTTRDNIRRTWLRAKAFSDGRAAARFVVGSDACTRHVQREASQHGDIAFVNASDCSPWHAGHKIHAWYRWALRSLPARWYGKAEDDSIVSIEPLLMELSMLPNTVHLFGVNLQWIAHCRQQPTTSTWSKPLAAQTCAQGCWLGRVASSLKRATRRPPRCEKAFDGRPVTPGSTLCPMLPYAPFAPGPLEVRSSQLAQLVASCSYADAYFHSLVTRGALINDECASTDGSQGHAIGECAAEAWGHLGVADGDMWRQSYANSGLFAHLRRAANTSATDGRGIVHPMYGGGRRQPPIVSIVHPLKGDRNPETWSTLWTLLDRVAQNGRAFNTKKRHTNVMRVSMGALDREGGGGAAKATPRRSRRVEVSELQ